MNYFLLLLIRIVAALLDGRQKRESITGAYDDVPVHEVFKVNLNSKKTLRSCYDAVGLDSRDLDEFDISENQGSEDMITEALVASIDNGLKRMRFRYCLCGNINSLSLIKSCLFHKHSYIPEEWLQHYDGQHAESYIPLVCRHLQIVYKEKREKLDESIYGATVKRSRQEHLAARVAKEAAGTRLTSGLSAFSSVDTAHSEL